MSSRDISNTDKIIDSRDIIRRLEELTSERQGLEDAVQEASDALKEIGDNTEDPEREEVLLAAEKQAQAVQELKDFDDDNGEELETLKRVNDEGEANASEWTDGVTLIHEGHFEEYAQELTVDIGDLPKNIPSYLVIDWSATAENLRQDYSEIEFDGETYYFRS